MPETKQPIWKQIGTVGDIHPIDYSGGFVYQDESGVYGEELEYIEISNEDKSGEPTEWKVYRWILDRMETVTVNDQVLLVQYGFGSRKDLPHPIQCYDEWFNKDLQSVASSIGTTVQVLRAMLCSSSPLMRANKYLDLAQYHGFENFDCYPLTFTSREELEKRYKQKNS